jgi:hypothetical protein
MCSITKFLFFIILLSQITASAEITFKHEDISERSYYSGQLVVLAVELSYPRNWDNVSFKSVKTSCGCVNASVTSLEAIPKPLS